MANEQLVLKSPAKIEPIIFTWPFVDCEQLIDCIRCVGLEIGMDFKGDSLKKIDSNNFTQMKELCDQYNDALENVSAVLEETGSSKCISKDLLDHILKKVRNDAITKEEELYHYRPFSPSVYGEALSELVLKLLEHVDVTSNDTFIDLGSGIGQVVLQVAASTACKISYGIEREEAPSRYAGYMENRFKYWMAWHGKTFNSFQLLKGDFLDKKFLTTIRNSTIVFLNNHCFGPTIDYYLKEIFVGLKDGTKIFANRNYSPVRFRVNHRNFQDLGAIMRVRKLPPIKDAVSWTDKAVTWYLHVIDRSKLKEFYENNPNIMDFVPPEDQERFKTLLGINF